MLKLEKEELISAEHTRLKIGQLCSQFNGTV